jgi:hypothetical protein
MERTTKPTPQNMTEARLPNRTILKKAHDPHCSHCPSTTAKKKTHHTNTRVMAKKLKRKNKNPAKEGGVLHA